MTEPAPLPPDPSATLFALGPKGTFSDQAAVRLRGHLERAGEARTTVYTRTIPEVLSRVETLAGSYGVVPIENSDTGTVNITQDLIAKHALGVRWEINVRVRFALLSRFGVDDIEELFAHPVAFDQCGLFLSEQLPRARTTYTSSNIDSAERFTHADPDALVAALVPMDFAARHGAQCVARDVQNDANNTTRFLVVEHATQPVPLDPRRAKTSMLIDPKEDRPGLLYDILSVFKRHDINLCRLESRPNRVRPWAYVFYLDVNNGARSAAALAELGAGDWEVRVLGSYDTLPDDA